MCRGNSAAGRDAASDEGAIEVRSAQEHGGNGNLQG
jgi:hypothetical protein